MVYTLQYKAEQEKDRQKEVIYKKAVALKNAIAYFCKTDKNSGGFTARRYYGKMDC